MNNKQTRKTWTPETVEKLKKILEDKSLSFSEVATRMGEGFTRNMIIGKYNRIHGYRSYAREKQIKETGQYNWGPKEPKPINLVRVPKPKKEPEPKKPEPLIKASNISKQCSYMHGDYPPYIQCEYQRKEKSFFCPAHHEACTMKPPKRRDKYAR